MTSQIPAGRSRLLDARVVVTAWPQLLTVPETNERTKHSMYEATNGQKSPTIVLMCVQQERTDVSSRWMAM
jgi:hypothetical protein